MFGIKRSMTDVRVAGVLGGIAQRFHINSKVLRITYLIGIFLTSGLLIPGYFLLMMVIPKDTQATAFRCSPFMGSNFYTQQRPRKEAKHVDDWSDF